MSSNLKLKGTVTLVTGGSGTVGSEIVKSFAKLGSSVIVHYNSSKKKSEKILKELDDEGNHSTLKANLNSRSEIKSLFKKINRKYNRLDFLINNAAFTKEFDKNEILNISSDEVSKMTDVNIKALFYTSIEALTLFKKTRKKESRYWRGNIINIISNSIKTYSASNFFYIATKEAANSLTMSFAKNYGNILRANSIAPGLIKSNITVKNYENRAKIIKKLTPTGELISPRDVGNVATSIAADFNNLNGQCIFLDGGRTI